MSPRSSPPTQPRQELRPAGDLGLAKVAVRTPTTRRLDAFPVSLVSLAGAPAPMLLPNAIGSKPGGAWKTYVEELSKVAAFPDQKQEIKALSQMRGRVEPLRTDRPWVAIMVSEPSSLLPGEFETLDNLAKMVRKLGCQPVLVPPMLDLVLPNEKDARRAAIESIARRCHGLIGPGGADVHPRIYKSRITHSIDPVYPRDRFEADFVTAAMNANAFLLGVCRSHQLWNAAAGGRLVQDVELEELSSISQDQDKFGIPRSEPFVVRGEDGQIIFENRVKLSADSQLAGLLGEESVVTNSLHHQAVAEPGRGFRVTGVVPDPVNHKDTIEATEAWNTITTQFHPELMLTDERFHRLVETVVRRAHVFFHREQLEAEGRVDVESLIDRVTKKARGVLSEIDHAWIKTQMAPALGLA